MQKNFSTTNTKYVQWVMKCRAKLFETYFNIQMTNTEWKCSAVRLNILCALALSCYRRSPSHSLLLLLPFSHFVWTSEYNAYNEAAHSRYSEFIAFISWSDIARFYDGVFFKSIILLTLAICSQCQNKQVCVRADFSSLVRS